MSIQYRFSTTYLEAALEVNPSRGAEEIFSTTIRAKPLPSQVKHLRLFLRVGRRVYQYEKFDYFTESTFLVANRLHIRVVQVRYPFIREGPAADNYSTIPRVQFLFNRANPSELIEE